MPRHLPSEAYQMDHLRSSPSQQRLDPSRSSSLSQPEDEDDGAGPIASPAGLGRPHKLDLYSIPVFLLEVLVLCCLAAAAYYIHFQYHHEPLLSGFYCDEVALRHTFTEDKFIQQFSREDTEQVVLALLLAVPIVLIIFCELVNSLFGSLKFRQIRALCTCCKLHSITRRTIRFSGAYALGFFIVVISCNVLATTSGRLRPYFAQECPALYKDCDIGPMPRSSSRDLFINPTGRPVSPVPRMEPSDMGAAPLSNGNMQPTNDMSNIHPLSPPISSNISSQLIPSTPIQPAPLVGGVIPSPGDQGDQDSPAARFKRDTMNRSLLERKWIELSGVDLASGCHFQGDSSQTRKFEQLARSWPSFPAAVLTYACLFVASYLSFVGTARPFRAITCVLVMLLLLSATIFDVELVKAHYNHWEDALAGAALALIVVVFVLLVYLNKFRDTHYYENQKVQRRRPYASGNLKGYNNELAIGQYNLDKSDGQVAHDVQNGDTGGSISNNDLAMRYFQIPRANYRGAPRPLSSLNQMRS